MMKRWLQRMGVLALFMALVACVGNGSGSGSSDVGGAFQAQGRDYFPGGHPSYSAGTSQSKENFTNVERAQWNYSRNGEQRNWGNIKVKEIRASAQLLGIYTYYPLDVRWKLKDGREFILEKIDVRTIMFKYFKTHDIKTQWQLENRTYDSVGDFGPLLAIEVKDDTVRIKWAVTTNHMPVDKRLTPKGAATLWTFSEEEYLVAVVKGNPTQGMDFNKYFEFRNPG